MKGVQSKIRVPTKKIVLVSRSRVPPAMAVSVPSVAVPIPTICLFDRRYLNIRAERTLMRIDARRQTRIEVIGHLPFECQCIVL